MQSRRVWDRRLAVCAGVGALVLAAWVRHGYAHPSTLQDHTGTSIAHVHPHPQPQTPEEAARRAEVVVRFASGQLTVGQLEDAILDKNPYMQQRYLTHDAVRSLLDRSLRFELLAAEAERRGYDKHTAVVYDVKQNLVQALIRSEFDTQITPDSIPADDVKKYYDEHVAEFVRPETRRASRIVLSSESEAQALSAQARASDLRGFRELARSKGADGGNNDQRASDVRYFDAAGRVGSDPEAVLDPAIAKALFGLKNLGDTSAVLKTGEGYTIVKLAGQRPAQTETLKQADERIRFRLWRERREAAIDARLATLRKESQLEVHPELIDAVKLDAAPLPPGKGLPAGFPHTRPVPVMTPPDKKP
jgi:peptidyl-prolyl cis-trans isomerase C